MSAQRCKGAVFAIVCLLIPLGALIPILDTAPTQAATSSTITFQARLLGASGNLVADGTYNIQFNLYDVSSGGTTLWTESRLNNATQGVTLKNGYFSVDLGSITSFPGTINWDQELWLGMTVRGTGSCVFGSCTPTDAEMTPRFKLTAVPYATSAGQLQKTNGANSLKVVTTSPTANITYTFQDAAAGTYNVCTSANNCTSLGSYIQNQNGSDQTANFRITGTGRANTSFTSPAFDSITGAVTLGGTTATGVTLGNVTNTASFTLQGTVAATYTIGTATGTGAITVGQSTATNTISIGSAAGSSATQTINIGAGTSTTSGGKVVNIATGTPGAGTTNTVAIGNGGAATGTVSITIGSNGGAAHTTLIQGGNGATAIQLQTATGAGINIGTLNNTQTITVGNTGGATSVNLYAASGITIDGAGATTYNFAGSTTTGTVTVGATLQTGLLTVGRSTATNTISIGSAVTSATNTQTVNIANGAGAGTAINVNILSGAGTAGTGTLSLGNNPRVTQIDLGNSSASAARTVNIATGNSGGTDTLNIATGNLSGAFNKVVNIANGNPSSSGVNQVTIGSIAAGGNTTTIQGGNGATALRLMTAASGTLSLGDNGVASTVQIGNTTGAVTQTINIGNNATASSTTNITIGSTIAGTTTLQGLASLTGAVLQGTNTTGLTFEGATADAFETTLAVVDPTVGDQIYRLPNAAAAGTYDICTTANNCTSLGSYIQNSTANQNTANFNIQSTGTTNVTAKIRANASQTADLLQVRNSADAATLFAVQADGDLEVDTNTLFVNATNNNVVIGGTSAVGTEKLTVRTVGNDSGIVHTDGTIVLSTYIGFGQGYLGTDTNHPFLLYANSVDSFGITSGNLVFVGGNATGATLASGLNDLLVQGNLEVRDKTLVTGTTPDVAYDALSVVNATSASTTNDQRAFNAVNTISPASASTRSYAGLQGYATTASANVSGAYFTGVLGQAANTSTGTLGSAIGVQGQIIGSSTGTITNAIGLYANVPAYSGTITNNRGLVIENQTAGTNDTNLLIGTGTTGNWSIYNNSSYNNLFGGSIVANNSSAGTSRSTAAGGGTNTTTVTITVAGFANGDVIYINNAGQDYYTRITAGGGTTSLTVSPAVSWDASCTNCVTSWNVQNIGASATDYTTQTNRFFQGYFLGGVVTGAGSTTLSDGILNSTTALALQTGGTTRLNVTSTGNIGIGTSGTPAQLLSIGGTTGNLTVDTAGAVVSASTIRSNSGFNFNGTAGASTTCTGGQIMQNQVTSGGIVTGGTCSSAGTGTVTTTGTPVANQVAYFNAASVIQGSANYTWDDSAGRLSVTKNQTTNTGITVTNGNAGVSAYAELVLVTDAGSGGVSMNSIANTGYGGAGSMNIGTFGANRPLSLVTNNVSRLTVGAAGAVSIPVSATVGGTSLPSGSLFSTGSTTTNAINLGTGDPATGAWWRNDGSNTVISTNVGSMYYGYSGSAKNLYFYNGGTTARLTVDTSGNTSVTNNLSVGGTVTSTNVNYINTTSPTIILQDSDNRNGAIHQNSNIMYFLSGSGTNGSSWTINGSYWPLTLNMNDDQATFGGAVSIPEGTLYVSSSYLNNTDLRVGAGTGSATLTLWGSTVKDIGGGLVLTSGDNILHTPGSMAVGAVGPCCSSYTLDINATDSPTLEFHDANTAWGALSFNGNFNFNSNVVTTAGAMFSSSNLFYNGNIWNDAQTTVSTNRGTVCWDIGDPFGAGSNTHDWYARCSSVRALKKDIVDITDGLETIRQLQPRYFTWKSSGMADFGFIAEEVEAVNPILAEYKEDGTLSGVHYLQMSAIMAQGIKQLDVQVQDIDARLAVIEAGEFSGNLTVAGYTELNGNLTVQGDTTVQKLTVNGKIITGGAVPTVVVGTVSGVASAVTVVGNDTAGKVSYTTGAVALPTNPVLAGAQFSATFSEAYAQAPRIAITPKNQKAASVRYFVETTEVGFTMHFIDVPDASTQYDYDYIVIQ